MIYQKTSKIEFVETYVVNLRNDYADVYIGRGSIWGNPYCHVKSKFDEAIYVETREKAIEKYEEYARNNKAIMGSLYHLVGKRLGCYCKPKACHGDILIKLMKEKGLING